MSLHRNHPLASMRDRWKFQLDHLPQGDARAMLRRCLNDVNLAVGEALLGVLAAAEEAESSGPLCDGCDTPGPTTLHSPSGVRLCATCSPGAPSRQRRGR